MNVEITVSVRRDYGVEVVEFSASKYVEIATANERHAEYLALLRGLHDECRRYEEEVLPNLKVAPRRASDKAEPGEWIRCNTLSYEDKGGKRYHSITGGQFTKFGVRVWPEVLEAADIVPGDEDRDLSGYDMLVVDNQKGGVKVSALRRR